MESRGLFHLCHTTLHLWQKSGAPKEGGMGPIGKCGNRSRVGVDDLLVRRGIATFSLNFFRIAKGSLRPLSKPVRDAVVYRQAGFSIGSGTICLPDPCPDLHEAGGMRWSRRGATAMTYLRLLSLSDRWHISPALT